MVYTVAKFTASVSWGGDRTTTYCRDCVRPCRSFIVVRISTHPSLLLASHLKIEHALPDLLRFRQSVVLRKSVNSLLQVDLKIPHGPFTFL